MKYNLLLKAAMLPAEGEAGMCSFPCLKRQGDKMQILTQFLVRDLVKRPTHNCCGDAFALL